MFFIICLTCSRSVVLSGETCAVRRGVRVVYRISGISRDIGADMYRLFTWQLALFGARTSLNPWPCQLTGEVPNGFSIEHGGAVRTQDCPTALPVDTRHKAHLLVLGKWIMSPQVRHTFRH